MLIQKSVNFRPGIHTTELCLAIAALNKYLKENPEPSTGRERSYKTNKFTEELKIRERKNSITIKYTRHINPKKNKRTRILAPEF